MTKRMRVLIMGAAGRDFHNFNTFFRDNDAYEVVAFTAAQIPYIDGRRYPAVLAGPLYPDGILIHPRRSWPSWSTQYAVDQVVFAYSRRAPRVRHAQSCPQVMAAGRRLPCSWVPTTPPSGRPSP